MKCLLEVVKLSADYLQGQGIDKARREAEELIADVLGCKRIDLFLDFERPLTEDELQRCRQSLKRRAAGEPVQHIRGSVDFYGCSILVNPQVLIPRHETEILVDLISKQIEEHQNKILVDLCCGSGCIGISLKNKFNNLRVILSDISVEALSVARTNAQRNEAEVEFRQGDLLDPLEGVKADYLVCNPPYIREDEFQGLEREVRDFEPRTALISGPTGLEFYQRLAQGLPTCLNPGAKVWFEIGTGQGNALLELFSAPCWKEKRVEKDWAGHERFFFLEIE